MFVEPGPDNEDLIAAKLTLDKILMETGKDIAFRLYPLEQLVHRLHKKCFEMCQDISVSDLMPLTSLGIAKDFVSRNNFLYLDIGCDFHRSVDSNQYCCLSKVKSWGFMISRYCLNDLDKKIPGRHFPEDNSVQSSDLGTGSWKEDAVWEDDVSHGISKIRIQDRTQSHTTIAQNSEIALSSSTTSFAGDEVKNCTSSISSLIRAGGRKKKPVRGVKQL